MDSHSTLSFAALRAANVARLPLFKNRRGEPAHSQPDGADWSLGEWCNAVLGELGEAANLIKKVKRGDITLDEARPALAKEYADVATYLDILAFQTGVDLGAATAAKWDEVSERIDIPLRISAFETHPDSRRLDAIERFATAYAVADEMGGDCDRAVSLRIFDDGEQPDREWSVTGPAGRGFTHIGDGATLREAIDKAMSEETASCADAGRKEPPGTPFEEAVAAAVREDAARAAASESNR